MTQKQFRHDLRRGLGSCLVEMNRCSDIEAYRKDVLWGLQYAMAYDPQCEGTRAIYFYDMIKLFEDRTEFFELAAAKAKRKFKDYSWRFDRYMELLALMAGDGYPPAQKVMAELYELLLRALQTGRPFRSVGCWVAGENFCFTCQSTLTHILQTQDERETFFLRVLADYGKLIQKRPALSSFFEEERFEYTAAETLGQERIDALLAEARDDPDIARYLKNREELRESSETYQAQYQAKRQSEAKKTWTAESIYKKLASGAKLPFMLFRDLEKQNRTDEIVALGLLYAREADESLRHKMLCLFHGDAFIGLLPPESVPQLLRDAESENETLRRVAVGVLKNVRDDRVRDYALQRLEQHPKDTDTIFLFMRNFQPGDGPRLIRLVTSVPINEHTRDWHDILMDVRKLIDSDPVADRELSAALLPYMFWEGYCSCCRLDTLELMQPRGLLTPELIEECRWDCDLDIREFVESV